MGTVADRLSADRAKFLGLGDFAASVSYTPSGGSATNVNVQWFEDAEELGEAGRRVEGKKVRILASTADIPNARHGETVVRNAITYKVRGVEPDGEGFVWLKLSRD